MHQRSEKGYAVKVRKTETVIWKAPKKVATADKRYRMMRKRRCIYSQIHALDICARVASILEKNLQC